MIAYVTCIMLMLVMLDLALYNNIQSNILAYPLLPMIIGGGLAMFSPSPLGIIFALFGFIATLIFYYYIGMIIAYLYANSSNKKLTMSIIVCLSIVVPALIASQMKIEYYTRKLRSGKKEFTCSELTSPLNNILCWHASRLECEKQVGRVDCNL